MALEYHTNLKFEKLAPVLGDYADWFAHIAVSVSYMNEDTRKDKIVAPKSFEKWVQDTDAEDNSDQELIADTMNVYRGMIAKGDEIAGYLQSDEKPDYEDFEEFKNLYSGFLTKLRRIERDSAMDSTGLDEETGFRSPEAILIDQKKEMERLKRQGTSFCLMMVRIDDFANSKQEIVLPVVVASIRHCVRAFDDAYYLGEGHFLLSLKQTDIVGAEAAADRLQLIIKAENESKEDISFSFCMAEPVEDDEIMDLMTYMREDLDSHDKHGSAHLKFVEMSPLQRYINNVTDAK